MNTNSIERLSFFPQVRRASIVDEIIGLFKDKLMAGELHPGERLPSEKSLMEQMGVGRTALREAMRVMSGLGVIEVKQGEGSYILSEPSSALMNPLVIALLLKTGASGDLLELRTMLQTAYCQMAAEKATEEDFSLIEQTASEFEQQSQSAQLNIDLLAQADLNFHYALIQATHNYLIIRLCSTFEELFFISIRDTIANPEGLSWGIVSHRYIIEAIRLNDPEKIKQAVIRSLEKWRGQIESPVEGGAA